GPRCRRLGPIRLRGAVSGPLALPHLADVVLRTGSGANRRTVATAKPGYDAQVERALAHSLEVCSAHLWLAGDLVHAALVYFLVGRALLGPRNEAPERAAWLAWTGCSARAHRQRKAIQVGEWADAVDPRPRIAPARRFVLVAVVRSMPRLVYFFVG